MALIHATTFVPASNILSMMVDESQCFHAMLLNMDPRTPLNLDQYLIEQVPPKVFHSVSTCSDPFLPDQSIRPYIPAKTGMDRGTQVEPTEANSFDTVAKPAIEDLTDKVMMQSLTEVREEEELKSIARRKERQKEILEERVKFEANLEIEERKRVESMVISSLVWKEFFMD